MEDVNKGGGRRAEVQAMFARHGGKYRALAVLTAMLGAISSAMQATVVNVALPDIIHAFDVSHDAIQLMSTGFLSASTVAMLVSHWAITRFGIKRTYLGGLALFILLSVGAALAQSFEPLVICRIGLGFISGILQPLAMVVVLDVYPAEERGRAMAVYGLGIILSPAAGPVFGGLLVDFFGWRAVMLVTVPFSLIAFALASRYLIRGRSSLDVIPALDVVGVGLLGSALAAVIGGLSMVFDRPLLGGGVIVAGAGLAAVFVYHQRRLRFPLLDFQVFRYRGFLAATLVSMAYGMGIHGSTYLVPLFAQTVAGFNASQAGLLLLPGGIVLGLVLLVSGRLADKYPPGRVTMLGLFCFAVSALLMGCLPGGHAFWLIASWVALGRIGLGFIIPGLSAASLVLLPRGNEVAVTAIISFSRQLGGALGVTFLALYLEFRSRMGGGAVVSSYSESFVLIGFVYAAALLPAGLLSKPRPH